MKKTGLLFLMLCMLHVLLAGCAREEAEVVKIRDLDFTVVATEHVPEELLVTLEEEKAQPFYRTYAEEGYMYLCVGYGEQETGGYSIVVNELYLTEEYVCMDTTLNGPGAGEEIMYNKSYPYIVICTEYIDRPVTFE